MAEAEVQMKWVLVQWGQTPRLGKDSWTVEMMRTQDARTVADLWVDNQDMVHCDLQDMTMCLLLGKRDTATFQGCLYGQQSQDWVDN